MKKVTTSALVVALSVVASAALASCTQPAVPIFAAQQDANNVKVVKGDGTSVVIPLQNGNGTSSSNGVSLSASASQTNDQLKIQWSGSFSKVEVHFGDNSNPSVIQTSTSGDSVTRTLSPDKDYTWQVVAFDSAGKEQARSSGTARYNSATADPTLTGLFLSSTDATSAKIKGEASNASLIRVTVNNRDFTGSPGADITADGLTAGSTYTASVRAEGNGKNSTARTITFSTTPSPTPTPTATATPFVQGVRLTELETPNGAITSKSFERTNSLNDFAYVVYFPSRSFTATVTRSGQTFNFNATDSFYRLNVQPPAPGNASDPWELTIVSNGQTLYHARFSTP